MEIVEDAQSVDFGMSTVMTHKAHGRYAEESIRAVREEAVRIEKLLSRFIQDSEISNINSFAGLNSVNVSTETYKVLERAINFSEICDGIFDITIGPLVTLWNSFKETTKIPDDAMIKKMLPLINYRNLKLDPISLTAELLKEGQAIDLGGIGKGYAGDKILEVFKKHNIKSAFTNIGGNVVALGTKPDGSLWRVGIQHPRKESALLGVVLVKDKAIVTSGDYQRYVLDRNNKRYHHILNPATGYPVDSKLVSVTVISENSLEADALSTILFIAGLERGQEILKIFKDVEVIFVNSNLQVFITSGLIECFIASKDIDVNVVMRKRVDIYES